MDCSAKDFVLLAMTHFTFEPRMVALHCGSVVGQNLLHLIAFTGTNKLFAQQTKNGCFYTRITVSLNFPL